MPSLFSPRKTPKSALTFVGVALSLTAMLHPPQVLAAPMKPAETASQVIQRLMQMFSPEIQQTLGACLKQGKVNLSAGADKDGSVICGDGTRDSVVQFDQYVDTYSDVVAASSLIGARIVLKGNPQLKPETVAMFVNTPNGTSLVRTQLRRIVTDSELVAKGSPQSVNFLVDKVMQRAVPILKEPRRFNSLLGTKAQYKSVVDNFCTPPGMSVTKVKNLVPDLNSVQLYAICIQDSGLADELTQRRASR